MRPLRIHFFTNYVNEQGTYFRAHNLARGLLELGQDVTVFSCDTVIGARARDEVREGVRYSIVPESWKTSVFSQYNHPLTAVRRYFRSYPPCDVAHLFQPMLGAAAAWTRCRARVKFYDWDDQWTDGLMTKPTSWRQRWPAFIIPRLEAALPSKADHVTAISHYLAARAAEFGAKNVTLIRSGARPFDPPARADARAELGLQSDALYVGFMGYTVAELPWCFEALEANLSRHPRLRLAVCGPPLNEDPKLSRAVRERIDHLGALPAAKARQFAAAIDLSLLPLGDTAFNRSRLPQKYGDHLVTGVPLLCSDIGECERLNELFPWVLRAGTSKQTWLEAFAAAVDRVAEGDVPPADVRSFAEQLSWDVLARRLLDTYQAALTPDEFAAESAATASATYVG